MGRKKAQKAQKGGMTLGIRGSGKMGNRTHRPVRKGSFLPLLSFFAANKSGFLLSALCASVAKPA